MDLLNNQSKLLSLSTKELFIYFYFSQYQRDLMQASKELDNYSTEEIGQMTGKLLSMGLIKYDSMMHIVVL